MSLNDVSDISALLSGEDHDVAQLEAELQEKRSSITQQEERVCILKRSNVVERFQEHIRLNI